MSPYPGQTNCKEIIDTAIEIIEQEGVDKLSLGKLATKLGIKAPSLYRHIANKEALMQAVIEQTYLKLFDAHNAALASASDDPYDMILKIAQAHRNFAHANPNTYLFAFNVPDPDLPSNPNMLLEHAITIQKVMAQISGEENSLPALRGMLAMCHGFAALELNGQLRRGGDLPATFDAVLKAYIQGWQ